MKPVIVYGLKSSRNDEIRYVGQTTQTLLFRLSQHRSYAKNKKTAVHKWMLRESGEGFVVSIVPLIENAVWNESEITLLAQWRSMGHKLLNLTDGGEGTVGWRGNKGKKHPHLAERNRRTKPFLGRHHSEESKEKMAAAKRGKPCPWNIERNKAQAGKPGHLHTEESRRKISEAQKGRTRSPEHCANISASKLGKVKLSDDAISKLRAGHKAYFDKRRNGNAQVQPQES